MSDLFVLLAGFQDALTWEYAPAIQYTQHAGLFDERGLRNKSLAKIGRELHKHAREEMEHAQILSHWIPMLGVVGSGHPSVPAIYVQEIATDILTAGRFDYRKMLAADLRGEVDAIERYLRLRSEVSVLPWPKARDQLIKDLDRILAVEREHARDLRKFLAQLGG
jgi:bacterioferritin (cytochrome b1)